MSRVAMFARGDATRIPLPDRSVDLVIGSPPYCDARTYGIGAQRDASEWVEWMLRVTDDALRVSKGAVIWIAAGVTRDRNYWPACEGLMWEWFKRGGHAYRPCYWHRVGIPGSGGDQWFRADVEYAMCFKRAGALPYANNTAKGHPPKWAPGGEMSHRVSDGTRRNQWGVGSNTGKHRNANGERQKSGRPSHIITTKKMHARNSDGSRDEGEFYLPPVLSNPGNMPNADFENGDIWAEDENGDVLSIPVGGGMMGSKIAHDNEAPFPEKIADFFIQSLTPEGSTVCDPFSGSGTTVSVAARSNRRGVGFDLRRSQCVLGRKRYAKQRTIFDELWLEEGR